MEEKSGLIPGGLAGKLIRFVIVFVLCLGTIFFGLSRIQVRLLNRTVRNEEKQRSDMIQGEYRESMNVFTKDSLLQMIIWAADKTDDEFWIIDHDMRSLGLQVEDVYRHPENYKRIPVYSPKKENHGKFVLQLMYPGDPGKTNPKTLEMCERLANLAPMMEEMVRGNEGYTLDLYISTPDGLTLAMDDLSSGKFEESGKIKEYDPTSRPWYQGAVANQNMFISSAVHSHFYDFNEVVYGYPVYVDGELVAVLESSTRLGIIEQKLKERVVGKEGFSVLISSTGQLVCSGRDTGELRMRDDLAEDIRNSVNPQLKAIIDRALLGDIAVEKVEVDGKEYYAAYAPLETLSWTQITFASVDEINEPTDNMATEMVESTNDMLKTIHREFNRYSIFLVVVLFILMEIAIFMASSMAKKRVHPIHTMTEAVREFVGQDMAFEMQDVYKTGDEIEELADSFHIMSRRMKEYVNEIVENTAEKERMQAEMEAASQIQLKMLPQVAPDFENKPGYELFANMATAKEVGGDLYDFYYLDDDRLVIMIGDVSGKGITAALFMALSKQMIKSQMVLHNGDLIEAVTEANKRLCEESADAMFVTVWIGVLTLSTGVLEFVNAGHMYAAVKRGDGEFTQEKDEHCLLMAGLDFAKYTLNTTQLNKGDEVYLYTDGVTEAHNKDEELFGDERFLAALNEKKDVSVKELDEIVRMRVAEFAGDAEQYDDITTLCFKYKGKE